MTKITRDASFWVICQKCHHAYIVSHAVIKYDNEYYCYRCEMSLKKELNDTLKDYEEFMNIIFELGRYEKNYGKKEKYDKLYELYNKRVIAN